MTFFNELRRRNVIRMARYPALRRKMGFPE